MSKKQQARPLNTLHEYYVVFNLLTIYKGLFFGEMVPPCYPNFSHSFSYAEIPIFTDFLRHARVMATARFNSVLLAHTVFESTNTSPQDIQSSWRDLVKSENDYESTDIRKSGRRVVKSSWMSHTHPCKVNTHTLHYIL